jgi:hypothetical protein
MIIHPLTFLPPVTCLFRLSICGAWNSSFSISLSRCAFIYFPFLTPGYALFVRSPGAINILPIQGKNSDSFCLTVSLSLTRLPISPSLRLSLVFILSFLNFFISKSPLHMISPSVCSLHRSSVFVLPCFRAVVFRLISQLLLLQDILQSALRLMLHLSLSDPKRSRKPTRWGLRYLYVSCRQKLRPVRQGAGA